MCCASQLCRHNHCLIKICNHKPYLCAPESSFDCSLLMRNKPKRLIPIVSLPLTFMQNRRTSDIQYDKESQRREAFIEGWSLMRNLKTPKGLGLTLAEGVAGGDGVVFDHSAPLSSFLHSSEPFSGFFPSPCPHLFSLKHGYKNLSWDTLKFCRYAPAQHTLSDKDRLPPIGNNWSLVAKQQM